MTESNSTVKPAQSKPIKPIRSTVDPSEPFPLTVHPCGYYSKKIRGRVHYFGKWADGPEAAERTYLERKTDLEAGRSPVVDEPHGDGLTVKGLLNDFRAHKKRMMERGDLTARTYLDVVHVCDFVAANLEKNRLVTDLKPRDFAELVDALLKMKRKGKEKSLVILGNHISRIKSVFRFAETEGLIPNPIRFGSDFGKPKGKNVERQRRDKLEAIRDEGAEPTFTRNEIIVMLETAGQPLKSMILLGINAGLGNSDLGQMRMAHANLETGWLDYPRPKNGKPRRAKLWPETVAAIKEWLAIRPEPTDPKDAKLVYLTQRGLAWHKSDGGPNPLSHEMRKLLDKLKINASRNFYALRATFRTEAARALDAEAVYGVMGHSLPGMGSHYVKFIHDDRLEKVAAVVHEWVYNGYNQTTGTAE